MRMNTERSVRVPFIFLTTTVIFIFSWTNAYISAALPCPVHCHCIQQSATDVQVDCQKRAEIDNEKLTEQLDLMLSSNLTYDRLTSLTILNTPLTHVPRSICRLTTLNQLNLDNNQLIQLPDNCFSNLTSLTSLTAARNKIQYLQDGLLDGLQKLISLKLNFNCIRDIGLHVFSNKSDITKLRVVDLSYNKLTSLEPWPIIRGQLATKNSQVTIMLKYNHISTFTNAIHWHLDGSKTPGFLNLDLAENEIQHLMDIIRGWNVDVFHWLYLIFYRHGHPSRLRLSLGASSFACDCIDYIFYYWTKTLPKARLFQNCYCNALYSRFIKAEVPHIPVDLRIVEIPVVPLDQFVCDLIDRCPSSCRCVHRPFNATLHVYCSNTNLTVLPRELPELPKHHTKYKLDFSNNRLLRRLEYRDYFLKTSILDVSNCAIKKIQVDVWKSVSNLSEVLLDGNLLKSLPEVVRSIPMKASVTLDRNPWMCSCNNRWMSEWVANGGINITNVDGIHCGSPERLQRMPIATIAKADFCSDPVQVAKIEAVLSSLSGVVGLVLLIVSVGVIAYRKRVKLYKRFHFHPFDRDECLGEDMDYDVFIACSSYDNLPHGDGIRVQLEERGYRICYSPRDFIAGESIYDNIYRAITRSKRTLCFLTSHFPQSTFCMYEFEAAFHHYIVEKRKKRLIVLLSLDSPTDLYANDASDTAVLRHFLRQYTYIDYAADDWFDKLLYALPLRGMGQLEGAEPAARNQEETDTSSSDGQLEDAQQAASSCEENQALISLDGSAVYL